MKKFATLGWLVVLMIAGCGGVVNEGDARKLDPLVKVFNLSPDTPTLDFYMNNELYEGNVEYIGSTKDFQSVKFLDPDEDEGLYDVSAVPSGALGDLDRITSQLAREKAFLYMGIGLQNPGTELSKRFRITQTEIVRDKPVGNKANLLVVHGLSLAPGSETPSISLQTPGDNPQFRVTDIAFGSSKPLTIDAGTFTFEARRADTDNSIYATSTFNFESGGLYLVAVTGVQGRTGAQAPKITFLQMSTK